MKRWQAIRAMDETGAVIKRRGSSWRYRAKDGYAEMSNDNGRTWRRQDSSASGDAKIAMDGWVIVRKKKALRDVWKDPRVGDVVRADSYERTVEAVTAALVAYKWSTGDGAANGVNAMERDGWERYGTRASVTVVSRAEDKQRKT